MEYATGHFGKWHIGPENQAKSGLYGIDVISAASGAAEKENNCVATLPKEYVKTDDKDE